MTLPENFPYSELLWSAFSRIRTEYGENSVRMRENRDQNNSEYGHLLRSEFLLKIKKNIIFQR